MILCDEYHVFNKALNLSEGVKGMILFKGLK